MTGYRYRPSEPFLTGFLALLITLHSLSAHAAKKCVDLVTPEKETLSALIAIKESAKSLTTAELGISREALLKAYGNDPGYAWIFDDLMNERVTFAMNRTEKRRNFIVENGFLNQFEAKRSGGTYDPKLRTEVEAAYSGMDLEAYKRIPYSNRPKYGYLAPPLGSKIKREDSLLHYGTDVYLFKRTNLGNRTTWTFGDSLDQAPLKEVKIPGPEEYRLSAKPIQKARRFLPWQDRGLMLPRFPSMGKGELPHDLSMETLADNLDLPNGKTMKYGSDEIMQNYIELQFWKPLTLDDVEAFVFHGEPPSGKFLKALRKRKILIYRYDKAKKRDFLWEKDLH